MHTYLSVLVLCWLACGTNGRVVPYSCRSSYENFDCGFYQVRLSTVEAVASAVFTSKYWNESNILFHQSTISALPRQLFDKFHQIKAVTADGVQIQKILSGTFTNAKMLNEIYLYDNLITNLENDAFMGAKNLDKISLYNNKIASLGEFAFRGLTKLTELYLDINLIKKLPANLFSGLGKLIYLDLQNNKLSELDQNTFANTLSMRDLNLSSNYFEEFYMEPLSILTELNELDLSHNSLKTIHILKQVNLLYASENKISSVTLDADAKSFNLTSLNLSRNKLKNIEFLTKLENLERLDLSDNEIEAVNFELFSQMMSLEDLILRNNKIVSITNGMSSFNRALNLIDVSGNALYYLDLDTFTCFPDVRDIIANDCKLIDMDVESIGQFKYLRNMSIAKNDWDCDSLSEKLEVFEAKSITFSKDEPNCPNDEQERGICCLKIKDKNVFLRALFIEAQKELKTLKKDLKHKENIKRDLKQHNTKLSEFSSYFKILEDDNKNLLISIDAKEKEVTTLEASIEKAIFEKFNLQNNVLEMKREIAETKLNAKILEEENETLNKQVKKITARRTKFQHDPNAFNLWR